MLSNSELDMRVTEADRIRARKLAEELAGVGCVRMDDKQTVLTRHLIAHRLEVTKEIEVQP